MLKLACGQVSLILLMGSLTGCSDKRGENTDPAPPVTNGSKAQMDDDLKVVDDYLQKWDQFAQGDHTLTPYIRDNQGSFEAALSRLLKGKDRRAPSRLVFYAVVQVGGFIAFDSELGQASAAVVGPDCPVFTSPEDGKRAYFAGDLYFWWLDNRTKYESYPLFDEWCARDFAKTVAIPMYASTTKRK